MKRTTIALFAYLIISGCIESKPKRTPELILNVEAINFCHKEAGKPYVWNDLQLRNPGSAPVVIHGIAVRGDKSCAFECLYERLPADGLGPSELLPCPSEGSGAKFQPFEIPEETTLLLKMTYTPSAPDQTDNAALVVTSDAANIEPEDAEQKKLVIPICGTGIEPITPSGTDAGSGTMAAPDAGPAATPDAGQDAAVEIDTGMKIDAAPAGEPATDETTCPACADPPKKGVPGCQQSAGD